MFSKLKKIFSKEEDKKEEIRMNFDRLKEYYQENVRAKESVLISDVNKIKEDSESMIRELLEDLENLKGKNIEERRAKSSEDIKNKFCIKSQNLLSSLLSGSKEMDIKQLKDVETFHDFMRKGIGKIDVSPKEVMHIKFFFSDDVSKIVRKINVINSKLSHIKNKLESDLMMQRSYVEKNMEDIARNHERIEKGKRLLEELSDEIKILEKKKNSIGFEDTSGVEEIKKKISRIDTRLSYIRQEINSNFSGVSRILKRAYHGKEDNLIEGYIKSPYDAFMRDDGRIRSVLLKTLVMVKDDKIDVEKKSLAKIETLIERMDEMSEYKKEIESLENELRLIRESERIVSNREEKNKIARKEIVDIEKRMASCKLSENNSRMEIEKASEDIVKNKQEIARSVSIILDQDIRLVE